jgi:hypothetical protein
VGPLLVAAGDSVTSGHEARQVNGAWRTACDDPGTAAATPGSSWAGDLRGLLGVPWNRYFNYAHSGSSTADVLSTAPYTNPCGAAFQQAGPQINDATAVLRRWPSAPGAANVAVSTAGVNDTNWVNVATLLVGRQNAAIGLIVGRAPAWAVTNAASCTDWLFGNAAGNPAAPPGVIAPAWDGVANGAVIAGRTMTIALALIGADPGAQVRNVLYYTWRADPNLPAVCTQAATQAVTMLNGWITIGAVVAKILWAFLGGDARRIQPVCPLAWNPGPTFIQVRLLSNGIPNNRNVPGWPHPNAAGRTALAACVDGTLPRAPGGGVA